MSDQPMNRRKGERRVSPAISEFALQEHTKLLDRITGLLADVTGWQKIAARRADKYFEKCEEVERLTARVADLEFKYLNMIDQRNAVADNLRFERETAPACMPDAILKCSVLSSMTGCGEHKVCLDFKTLADMQDARDVLSRAIKKVKPVISELKP